VVFIFTKKWRSETLKPAPESHNSKPQLKSGIFKCIYWLSSLFFGGDDRGFVKKGVSRPLECNQCRLLTRQLFFPVFTSIVYDPGRSSDKLLQQQWLQQQRGPALPLVIPLKGMQRRVILLLTTHKAKKELSASLVETIPNPARGAMFSRFSKRRFEVVDEALSFKRSPYLLDPLFLFETISSIRWLGPFPRGRQNDRRLIHYILLCVIYWSFLAPDGRLYESTDYRLECASIIVLKHSFLLNPPHTCYC
jgi:hypothetical protein